MKEVLSIPGLESCLKLAEDQQLSRTKRTLNQELTIMRSEKMCNPH